MGPTYWRRDFSSQSKIPPKLSRALSQIGDLGAQGVDVFDVHESPAQCLRFNDQVKKARQSATGAFSDRGIFSRRGAILCRWRRAQEFSQMNGQFFRLIMVQHVARLLDGFQAEIRYKFDALHEIFSRELPIEEHEVQRITRCAGSGGG